jgi:hypothetical protein
MAQPTYSTENSDHLYSKNETVISTLVILERMCCFLLLADTSELHNIPIICFVFHSIRLLLFKPDCMVMFAFPHKTPN